MHSAAVRRVINFVLGGRRSSGRRCLISLCGNFVLHSCNDVSSPMVVVATLNVAKYINFYGELLTEILRR
jgi:hypothetical protein